MSEHYAILYSDGSLNAAPECEDQDLAVRKFGPLEPGDTVVKVKIEVTEIFGEPESKSATHACPTCGHKAEAHD